jgi:hypothetical protein
MTAHMRVHWQLDPALQPDSAVQNLDWSGWAPRDAHDFWRWIGASGFAPTCLAAANQ